MSRSSLSGRSPSARVLFVFVTAVALLALVFGLQPAGSAAARAPGAKQESRGALAGDTGKLIAKYTTADSDTYELPDGHMLTRVFAEPVNQREADGAWQALPAGNVNASSASSTAASAGVLVPAVKSRPPGSEDELACMIDEATPSTSECNAATFQAGFYLEKTYNGDYGVHGLLQFALPNLHSEVTVLSAELELYETASTTTSKVAIGAYRVITPWEKGVTWNTTNGSTPWKAPGGDFAEPGSHKYAENPSVGTGKGWLYWYPTQFVQEWLNGTDAPNGEGQPNLGFLMKDVNE